MPRSTPTTTNGGRSSRPPESRPNERQGVFNILVVSQTESVSMAVNSKRVFYVKYLPNEIYVDILRARPDVRLDRLENETAEEISGPILAAAHAYQIGAA